MKACDATHECFCNHLPGLCAKGHNARMAPIPSDFKVGDRVALHPACDLWMRGARFGEVVGIGRKRVLVRLDHMTGTQRVAIWPANLKVI